jgi:hypothetical protein
MKIERVLIIIIICLIVLFACQCGRKAAVPEDLIGVWRTTEPSYADHPFEIKTDEVLFGTGGDKFDTYPITKIKIEKDPKEQGTLYIICYENIQRQEYKFSFYYDPANQGTIRFKNQKEMVWSKNLSLPPPVEEDQSASDQSVDEEPSASDR